MEPDQSIYIGANRLGDTSDRETRGCSLLRPRFLDRFGQVLIREMRITCSHLNRLVPHEPADSIKVNSILDQSRREGVSQRVPCKVRDGGCFQYSKPPVTVAVVVICRANQIIATGQGLEPQESATCLCIDRNVLVPAAPFALTILMMPCSKINRRPFEIILFAPSHSGVKRQVNLGFLVGALSENGCSSDDSSSDFRNLILALFSCCSFTSGPDSPAPFDSVRQVYRRARLTRETCYKLPRISCGRRFVQRFLTA